MFTINIPFKDALTCFQTLSHHKKDDDLVSIEKEFFCYAERQADVGDVAAREWLKEHKDWAEKFNLLYKYRGDSGSPMSFFAGMKRPPGKDKELEDLKNGKLPEESNGYAPSQDVQDQLMAVIDLEIDRKVKKLRRTLGGQVLKPADVRKAMKRFDGLVGLGQVKEKIKSILDTKIIETRREKAGLKVLNESSHHMVFSGNPGTGKTTVARIVADIFGDVGLLSSGHLVEVTRSELIGEYIGQTEKIVSDVIARARGGVLFIDEAYSLYKPHSQNDYGHEVITALIKILEEEREDLVVIMAGYEGHMKAFLKSNPGLKSRVMHHIHFDDMQAAQLMEIFRSFCVQYDYCLSEEVEKKLLPVMKDLKRQEESEFPNARGVRNLFEDVLRRQSTRLLQKNIRAKAKLKLILPEDVPSSKALQDGNIVHLPRK